MSTGHLVLSRGVDQSISIGDKIVVSVVSINGTRVKLMITAPKSITVHRNEVVERIAAATGPCDKLNE